MRPCGTSWKGLQYNIQITKIADKDDLCMFLYRWKRMGYLCIADPEWFVPDPEPTNQAIPDPDQQSASYLPKLIPDPNPDHPDLNYCQVKNDLNGVRNRAWAEPFKLYEWFRMKYEYDVSDIKFTIFLQ